MEKIIQFILLTFLLQQAAAQSCTVNAYKLPTVPKYAGAVEPSVSYPIISMADTNVSHRINEEIRSRIFMDGQQGFPIQEVLQAAVEDGLADMDYTVTFNGNGIFSITMPIEWCAAYCSNSILYFNFDLHTGEVLALENMIKEDSLVPLLAKVYNDKFDTLSLYKTGLQQLLAQNEIDTADYEWAIREVDEYCIDSLFFENFSITGAYIEVADYCEFPHAIRAMAPFYELKYNYAYLEKYLKEKYLGKLRPASGDGSRK